MMSKFLFTIANILSAVNLIFLIPLYIFVLIAFFISFGSRDTSGDLTLINILTWLFIVAPFVISLFYKLILLPKMIISFLNNHSNTKFFLKKHIISTLLISFILEFITFWITVAVIGQYFEFIPAVYIYFLSGGGLFVSYLIVFLWFRENTNTIDI